MIADVIGDVGYGDEDDYGEEGAGFKRENEANYDFMWSVHFSYWKESMSYFKIYKNYYIF